MAEYGFVDGWKRIGTQLRRIFFGSDPVNNPKDKKAKEDLERVIEEDKSWGESIGELVGVEDGKNGLLLAGIVVLIFLAIKD